MKYYRFIIISLTCLINACTAIPTTSSVNPWESPNRRFSITPGAEQDRFIASLQPCTEYAKATFADVLDRYEAGQPGEAGLVGKVIGDEKFYAWTRVHAGKANRGLFQCHDGTDSLVEVLARRTSALMRGV